MTTIIEFYIPEKCRKNSISLLEKYFGKDDSRIIEQGFYDFADQYCKCNHSHITMAKAIYQDAINN
ncbi:MAG: hypothetical protein QW303_05250, partial [Nitrososphaerota archaeon]